MSFNFNRKKILVVLILLNLILLITNLFVDKFYEDEQAKLVNSKSINDEFIGVLNQYGLDSNWIKKNKGKAAKESDYSIKLPLDIPIPFILNDFQNHLDTNYYKLSAVEKGINGNTHLKISSVKGTLLTANFYYDKKIQRQADTLSFLIYDIEEQNTETINNIFNTPFTFGFTLTPSKSNAYLVKKAFEQKREFCVMLNDNIDEIDYRFRNDYPESRWQNSITDIIKAYSTAAFFIIDNESNLYHSPLIYNFIKKNLSNRKIKFFCDKEFHKVEVENEAQERINYILHNRLQDNKGMIYLSSGIYLKLQPVFESLRKKGYKIKYPSNVI